MKNEFLNKIINRFKNNLKFILFSIVFCVVLIIYNIDNQTINFFFQRGVVLEYSIDKKQKINQEQIEEKLANLGIQYSFVENKSSEKHQIYDSDNELIDKVLYIGLPIVPNNKKENLINQISDYVFDNYQNSKLLNIKTLKDNYHIPYQSFVKFLGLFIVSLLVWLILLMFIFEPKSIKEDVVSLINKQKEAILNLYKNTKEKGIKYLLGKIFFEEPKDTNDKNKEIDMLEEILSTIVFVIVAVILIRFFIGELRWIPSGSMRPTILEKDRVFVEKLDFPKKDIKRGDILVFYPPDVKLKSDVWSIFTRLSGIFCKDIAFIKRVVGMPNDKFEIKYNKINNEYRVYINDVALNEPYIISKTDWTPCNEKMYCGPFVIPKNNYFMMGDNRGNSQDSRFWGFLEGDRVIGRANFMFFPISRINVLTDKYLKLHEKKDKNSYIEKDYIINRYEFLYNI